MKSDFSTSKWSVLGSQDNFVTSFLAHTGLSLGHCFVPGSIISGKKFEVDWQSKRLD